VQHLDLTCEVVATVNLQREIIGSARNTGLQTVAEYRSLDAPEHRGRCLQRFVSVKCSFKALRSKHLLKFVGTTQPRLHHRVDIARQFLVGGAQLQRATRHFGTPSLGRPTFRHHR